MKPQVKQCKGVEIQTFDGRVDVAVEDFIDRHRDECLEDAFYVCDLSDILRKVERWQRQLPRVDPHYAVKCNDDAVVLETLAGMGMGFDCASKGEIKKMLDIGVDPSRIIYANPCKQSNHIKYAASHNVKLMTFDNLDELEKIKVVCPDAKLVLRILPAEFKARCNLGIKFGAPQADVPALLNRARKLQLDIVGVSFHVGSGCQEAAAFPAAVQLARETFDLALAFGFQPYLLDIGGGFPGDETASISFEEICVELCTSLDYWFPEGSGVEIIAEPGRYMVASAYTLAVNVIAKRRPCAELDPEEKTAVEEAKVMYYVNDGVYGSFNCLLYDHATVRPIVPKISDDEPLHMSSIWGPTCDGLDCIATKTLLPELDVGDWIMFRNMGAYTLSAGSTFNGMPRPRGHYLVGMEELANLDCQQGAYLHQQVQTTPPTLLDAPAFDGLCFTY